MCVVIMMTNTDNNKNEVSNSIMVVGNDDINIDNGGDDSPYRQ